MTPRFGPRFTVLGAEVTPRLGGFWRGRLKERPLVSRGRRTASPWAWASLVVLGSVAGGMPALRASGPVPPDAEAGAPADDEALAKFRETYTLKPGEDLIRIEPPRLPGLEVFWRREYPNHGNRPKDFGSLVFRLGDRLQNWGGTTGRGYGLRNLPKALDMKVHPVEIEGDDALLKTVITGDFVFRAGVSDERMASQIEALLRRDLKLPVRLTFREVERDVVVARGTYRHKRVPGRSTDDIAIYGHVYVEDTGAGGGSGDFPTFLQWVGDWIDRVVVAEGVEEAPKGEMSWTYHSRSPATDEMRREDHDEVAVLMHVGEQTGLTYSLEPRPVRILFVERNP